MESHPLRDIDLQLQASLFVRSLLLKCYQIMMPIIAFSGIASFIIIFSLFLKRRRVLCNPVLLFAGVAFAVLYFFRLGLLVLVDISSFPVMGQNYIGPAFALVPAFAFLMYSSLNNLLKSKK